MTWVIPCFNEEQRLDRALVERLLSAPRTRVLLVDDGSTDGTQSVLNELARRHPARLQVLALEKNGGKAEAVRQGLLRSCDGSELVGFADADFSTPPTELHRLAERLVELDAQAVIGARVGLAGTRITRTPSRHYLGRIFGTAASLVLGAVIYDTQCGAKLFRVTPLLRACLAEPFGSRWIFDVELLGRLLIGTPEQPGIPPEKLAEVPLLEWRDVAGSKLGIKAVFEVPWQLIQTRRRLRSRRKSLVK